MGSALISTLIKQVLNLHLPGPDCDIWSSQLQVTRSTLFTHGMILFLSFLLQLALLLSSILTICTILLATYLITVATSDIVTSHR